MAKKKSGSSSGTVTVTIHYKNGRQETLRGVAEDRASYYEQLTFSNTDVISVSVKY